MRPGYSNIGKKVLLRANYFQVVPASNNLELYTYSLAILPANDVKIKRVKRRAVVIYLKNASFLQDPDIAVATDYSGIIVTTKRLDISGGTNVSKHAYYDEEEDGPRANKPKVLDYKIEFTSVISVGDLMSYLSSTDASARFAEKDSVIQALNIAIVRKPNNDPSIIVGSRGNKFFPLGEYLGNLGAGLVAIRGYYTSVRTSTLRLLLNVNTVTAAFYQPGSLLSLFDAYRSGGGDVSKLGSFVKQLRVELKHLSAGKGKNRVRTVYGVTSANKNALTEKFKWDEKGRTVTIQEYFKQSRFLTANSLSWYVTDGR